MIRTPDNTHPTGVINVVIELPHDEDDAMSGCLIGTGRVVRRNRLLSGDHSTCFAIAVRRYRVQRSDRILSGHT